MTHRLALSPLGRTLLCGAAAATCALAAPAPRAQPAQAHAKAAPHAAAKSVVRAVRATPSAVVLGDVVDVAVTVTHPPGTRVLLPDPLPETDVLRAVGPGTHAPAQLEAGQRGTEEEAVVLHVTYRVLDIGPQTTPDLPLRVDGAILVAKGVQVTGEAPADAPAAANAGDPAAPADVADTLAQAAPWISTAVPDARPFVPAALLVFTGLAVLLLRLAERRRVLPALVPWPPEALPPPPPPHHTALSRLDALLTAPPRTADAVEPFVTALMNDVLRAYLDARFDTGATAATTRELLEALRNAPPTGLDVAQLAAVLRTADMVKYAAAALAPQTAVELAGLVRGLIEATAQAAPETPAPNTHDAHATHALGETAPGIRNGSAA